MDAETLNRIEQSLANLFNNELNTALREVLDSVEGVDIELRVTRISNVGPEANYPYSVEPEFTWTWKRA